MNLSLFKRNPVRLFIVLVSVLVLAACAPVTQVAQKVVTLPEALQNAITALSVFAVGWVFAQIGAALPWFTKFFGQYADEIAFALAGVAIGAIQNALNMIPPAWEGVGNIALMLVVAVLAALQVFRLLGKMRVKSFRG